MMSRRSSWRCLSSPKREILVIGLPSLSLGCVSLIEIVLHPRGDRHLQPVLHRGQRTGVTRAVGAVGVVGIIEIELKLPIFLLYLHTKNRPPTVLFLCVPRGA